MKSAIKAVLIGACAVLVGAAGLSAQEYVGQLVSDGSYLGDLAVPAGTSIEAGATVTTFGQPAILHLKTGQLVRVSEESSAVVGSWSDGVRLSVTSGELTYRDAGGGAVSLRPGFSASLRQDDGIGGGTPVSAGDPNEEIAICHLEDENDPDDPDDDEWDRRKVERRDLQFHFDHGDVYADKDLRTDDMRDDVECGKAIAWWWWGGGALAAGIILADDDDNPPPASPIVP